MPQSRDGFRGCAENHSSRERLEEENVGAPVRLPEVAEDRDGIDVDARPDIERTRQHDFGHGTNSDGLEYPLHRRLPDRTVAPGHRQLGEIGCRVDREGRS